MLPKSVALFAILSRLMQNSIQYFDRAAWALQNATNEQLTLVVRSHLTAISVHACQSLKESLDQLSEDNPADAALVTEVKDLPHTEIIENVRNMDLHGWPLPVCDPKVHLVEMKSKPDKPITLSSSHGAVAGVTMAGASPKVHNQNRKHANVKFGGATVALMCDHGRLVVHDFSTNKAYFLLGALEAFLKACHPIITSRMSSKAEPADIAPQESEMNPSAPEGDELAAS